MTRTLYIGVTEDLERRVFEHKYKQISGFTSSYNVTRLVYYEVTPDVHSALEREKQLKGWRRERKIRLIEETNPEWKDLSLDWVDTEAVTRSPSAALRAQGDINSSHSGREFQ